MQIAIGADHGGFALKLELVAYIKSLGHSVADLGAHRLDADDDFPDFAVPVARAVAEGKAERGIVLCGSGVGASVVANKVAGVRAAVCHDTYSAHQGVEHDDMNVLCLGARVIGPAPAREIVKAFLDARMDPHPRFRRRLEKVLAVERHSLGKDA
ncbi:MAG: RpiB/LacA/LacB family sugar-phosphate isomerase [SAR202 cluster bacterium]|nr:RpiB/LacA/LacB family sugar-phosphate isomerase [SAR202 cluster bacterium]